MNPTPVFRIPHCSGWRIDVLLPRWSLRFCHTNYSFVVYVGCSVARLEHLVLSTIWACACFREIQDLYFRAASFVDKILKGGKPADLPIEQPTKFELVFNLKTANAIGLMIPSSLLLRTDGSLSGANAHSSRNDFGRACCPTRADQLGTSKNSCFWAAQCDFEVRGASCGFLREFVSRGRAGLLWQRGAFGSDRRPRRRGAAPP